MHDPNIDLHRAGDLTFAFNGKATKCLRIMRTYTTITLADMDAQQAGELFEFLKEHCAHIKSQETIDESAQQ